MPYPPGEPFSRTGHNRRATGRVGVKATRIANAIIAKTGDDAKAIRIANAYVKRHRGRGIINRGGK